MRLDVVTIFPAYLEPLSLSLIGAARREGLLDVRVHDLRDQAEDRHRTVDDSPLGGGAGMVMKPEPWAAALDALVRSAGTPGTVPHLLVPGPGGVPFSQALARELAGEPWLAFACGRYEGIDERVYEHAAARMPVTVVSVGDYVLSGGEVAVLAIVEAVARLLPGVIGNRESLLEESHEDGLLEYPVYTRPAAWRDGDLVREVPSVLLSGDHGRIARWRHEQRVRRTATRRPDLLHPSAAVLPGELGAGRLRPAVPGDVGELLTLTHAGWLAEGIVNDRLDIPAQHETVETLRASLEDWNTWVLRIDGRLVGSVRARVDADGDWYVGRLVVVPDLRGRGLGRWLLDQALARAPGDVTRAVLTTGVDSTRNRRMYERAGFRVLRRDARLGTVELFRTLR